MSLKINSEETINDGLKRILLEECQNAVDCLNQNNDPDIAIHEARKTFKKIRAILRLSRSHNPQYKKYNAFFRDQGYKISELRDAQAIVIALELLHDRYKNELYVRTFQKPRIGLEKRKQEMINSALAGENALVKIGDGLKNKIQEIKALQLDVEEFEDLSPNLLRVYKRGLKSYQKAKKSHDAADFHLWRKQAKYLRYQIETLKIVWKPVLQKLEDEFHVLTDYLGDAHDLHNLEEIIRSESIPFKSEAEKSLLLSLIRQNQEELRAKALLLGKKLYALKPNNFVEWMEKSWQSYEEKHEKTSSS